ncbi:hypothetical protein FQN52_009401 [Onygenales sp. PD_12]|nr:hypothetical protein FQN52_009401 [Onygenales sp. PD_12]
MNPTQPERRRRRPAVSCTLCRRQKIRCNREWPCNNCAKSRNKTCVYESDSSPSLATRNSRVLPQVSAPQYAKPSNQIADSSGGSATTHGFPSPPSLGTRPLMPSSEVSAREVEVMKSRIKELEEQLSRTRVASREPSVPVINSNVEIKSSLTVGDISVRYESRVPGEAQTLSSSSVFHKSRLFGQSHWVNSVVQFRDIFEIMEPYAKDASKMLSDIQKCKSLARIIKSRRAPSWPSPPRTDLPPKDVADKLVDGYLRTFETVYRVLHVPTFKRDYDAVWELDSEPPTSFLIQLKLVLAIGATIHDEKFSMRSSAIHWVYEAQAWLSDPDFKSRLSLQTLQTSILHLLARQTSGIGEGMIWVAVGGLLRIAIHMGLHRDTGCMNNASTFIIEMRRRLWNTILEIYLQSCIDQGGPALISLDAFDTRPPRNFDDEQLLSEEPVPKPDDAFSQTSIAIALCKIFPLRLAITMFLNDLGSQGTYDETLRLDAELKAAYKVLCQTLNGYPSSNRAWTPSQFQLGFVDLIFHRYLSALHIPFSRPPYDEAAAYTFSRNAVAESSLKILRIAYPASSLNIADPSTDNGPTSENDLGRLTYRGSGFIRAVCIQAGLMIAAELKRQLREQSLGPVALRPDLLAALDGVKEWTLQCVREGKTNIKGYLIISALVVQIDGLSRRLPADQITDLVMKASKDVVKTCLPILEEMAAQSQETGGPMGSVTPPEAMEDWDFMMSAGQFNIGAGEPMNWVFSDDDMIQGPPLW